MRRRAAGLVAAALLAIGPAWLGAPPVAVAAWSADFFIDLGGGDGAGRATADDDSIDCVWDGSVQTGDCSEHYVLPDFLDEYVFTITITPATGSVACVQPVGCTLSGAPVSKVISLSSNGQSFYEDATLSLKTFKVEVAIDGPGSVTSNGTSCTPTVPADYCRTFKYGTTANLTAVPDTGKVFTYWGGDPCDGGPAACSFTVTRNLLLGATFGKVQVTLDVVGSGDVCTPTGEFLCTVGFTGGVGNFLDVGLALTLVATPKSGWQFDKWNSGPCSGKPATCSFTVTTAADLVATFKRIATPAPTVKPTTKPSPAPTVGSTVGPTPASTAEPSALPTLEAPSIEPGASGVSPSPGASSGESNAPSGTAASPQASTPPLPDGSASTGGIDPTVLILLAVIVILTLVLGFVLGRQRLQAPRT